MEKSIIVNTQHPKLKTLELDSQAGDPAGAFLNLYPNSFYAKERNNLFAGRSCIELCC